MGRPIAKAASPEAQGGRAHVLNDEGHSVAVGLSVLESEVGAKGGDVDRVY